MPFEWVVGDSSKDHTVTASMFYDVLATVRYTTLWGITDDLADALLHRLLVGPRGARPGI